MKNFVAPLAAATLVAASAVCAAPAPELAEALRWLPAEIDAMVVVQDFDLPKNQQYVTPTTATDDPLASFLRLAAAGQWLSEPALKQAYDKLVGRDVDFALLAGREFFPISAFGFCGYAGCHLVRFADPLADDAERFSAALREGADEVVAIAGRDVAIFKWTFGKESYLKDRSWESLLVVLPERNDRDMIVATQRTLLESVLRRRSDPDLPRAALAPKLPAWQHVDTSADVWAILVKPLAGNRQPPPAEANVLTYEYHVGRDARFVLRCPAESLPSGDAGEVDPSANPTPPTAALVVSYLHKSNVRYQLDHPADEPARLTISWSNADAQAPTRGLTLIFMTGALFQHCFEP